MIPVVETHIVLVQAGGGWTNAFAIMPVAKPNQIIFLVLVTNSRLVLTKKGGQRPPYHIIIWL
jgi:hypothetical protein